MARPNERVTTPPYSTRQDCSHFRSTIALVARSDNPATAICYVFLARFAIALLPYDFLYYCAFGCGRYIPSPLYV